MWWLRRVFTSELGVARLESAESEKQLQWQQGRRLVPKQTAIFSLSLSVTIAAVQRQATVMGRCWTRKRERCLREKKAGGREGGIGTDKASFRLAACGFAPVRACSALRKRRRKLGPFSTLEDPIFLALTHTNYELDEIINTGPAKYYAIGAAAVASPQASLKDVMDLMAGE